MVERENTPRLCQVVLDCTDARSLAEFYRALLGLVYRPGDEPPEPGQVDERGADWLVLRTRRAARSWPSSRLIRCRDRAGRTARCPSSCIWISA